jgi:hypothetical protein
MAVVIDSGQLPSSVGKKGQALEAVIRKWQSIAQGRFRDDCRALLQMIDETDTHRLWETYADGWYKDRDTFLRKVVLIDYDLTEQSLSEIVARLRRGENVRLTLAERTVDRAIVVETLAVQGRPLRGNEKGDNSTFSRGSTSADYLTARIKRDRPDIAERMQRGEFRSVRAAAIEAGLVARPDPMQQARRAFERLPPEDRDEFIQWLKDTGYV